MGRITVFTGEDFNSLLVLKVLKDHDLPYSEISLSAHPERLSDLKALTGKASVPRVFFNTRPIGGVEEIVRELRRWERSSSSFSSSSFLESSSSLSSSFSSTSSSSSSVRDRYETDIATHNDPGNPRLALPKSPPLLEPRQSFRKPSVEPSVDLMDGTKTTFFDITEKLKNSLSFSEIKDKNVIYKKAFSGKHLTKTLEVATGISNEAARDLAKSLLNAKVFHPLSSSASQFVNAEDTYYRLQCHKSPHVLNSYRHWDQEEMTQQSKDPVTLLADLDSLLHMIEIDSAQSNGLLDCTQALRHRDFGLLEELASQLQVVKVSDLPAHEVIPFCLNIYGFMLRYAFIKVGIPLHESDRLHFLNHVAFGLNGHTFTLNEWVNGVLRGNSRSPNTNKSPFGVRDGRRKLFAFQNNKKVDHRIHYALNVGAKVGNRTSLPFQRFTAEKLEEQLELVSSVFWEDGSNFVVDLKNGEVSVPKSIGWYMVSDLGRDVSEWMNKIGDYLPIAQKHDYSKMLQQQRGRPKVTYSEVNWAKNACNFTRYDKEAIVAEMKGLQAMITRRFLRPAVPANESERVEALDQLKLNILDNLQDERFDRITQMVQARFGVFGASIGFVGRDNNFVKSMACSVDFKPGSGSMKREYSLCSHAILSDDIMVVPDILQDDRYADCPSAKALGGRFYAACPLNIPSPRGDGSRVNVGTLAIFDVRPRDFSKEDEDALRSFGDQVKACLDYSQ